MPENVTPLEAPTRLSQSVLWDLSRGFYLLKGPRAWAEAVVPSAVSTHPRVARAYAHLVVAFLRDCVRAGVPLDLEAPVYVVELGTGPGRLGYRLARALRSLEGHMAGLPRPMVVATDLAEGNLEFVQNHPFNRMLVEERRMDFARYDAERDEVVRLREAGVTLGPGPVENPVVVVANYIFDSLRADAYKIEDGQAFEVRVAAYQAGEDAPDPARLEGFDVERSEHLAQGPQYPEDPLLDELLDEYRHGLDHSGVFLPIGPIEVMRRLSAMSGGPMLLLHGDKTHRTLDEMRGQSVAGLVKHGSFSITVNGHALQRTAERLGGFALHSSGPDTVFTHSIFVTGAGPGQLPETTLAFEAHVEDFGPREAQRMAWALSRRAAPDAETALLQVRMSGYDPWLFRDSFPVLFEAMAGGSYLWTAEMDHLVDRVAAQVYPLRPGDGICLAVARAYQAVGRLRQALRWFRNALAFDPPTAEVYHYLGLCLEFIDPKEALEVYAQALALDPSRQHVRDRIRAVTQGLAED